MKYAVIADDLTGANDTGVQFAKSGLTVSVLLEPVPATGGALERDVLVWDTDSRSLDALSAYRRTAEASRCARLFGAEILLKKLDSTMRGNLGAEIDAVYDTFRPDFVVIAPAFPGAGRQIRGGRLLVHGEYVDQTEFARDPKTPVTDSYIPGLLGKQSKRAVEVVSTTQLAAGGEALGKLLDDCRGRCVPYLLFDAETDADLQRIVSLLSATVYRFVWVGSAGLAGHLVRGAGTAGMRGVRLERQPVAGDAPEVRPGSAKPYKPGEAVELEAAERAKAALAADTMPEGALESRPTSASQVQPVLALVGSVSPRARKQLDGLLARADVRGIRLEAHRLIGQTLEREDELSRAEQEALLALGEPFHTVIYTSGDREAVRLAQEAGARNGLRPHEVSDAISRCLGEIAWRLMERADIGGLIMTGGDTARQVCAKLQTAEIELTDEVETGVPVGVIAGERPIPAVTKAGGFGSDEALIRALEALKGVNVK